MFRTCRLLDYLTVHLYFFFAFLAFHSVLFATIYTISPPCTVCNRDGTVLMILVTKF